MRSKLLCALALGGLALTLVAGCGADAGSSDSAGSAASKAEAGTGGSAQDLASKASSGSSGTAGDRADKAAVARLVRTADITVEVPDVARAAEQIRTAAVSLGGIVSTETTTSGPPVEHFTDESESSGESGDSGDSASSQAGSVITVRVPEPKMDDALGRIAGVGRELDRSTSTEDVTATIADLDSRVQTQIRSVARVRDLLSRAKSLQDVVLLESELSKREADLESVQARQRALSDKATLATVTVTLVVAGGSATQKDDDNGFLVGLRNGWNALKVSTAVVLTIVGALIPLAALVALVGLPAYLIRRRRRAASSAASEAPPAPPVPMPEEETPAPV